MPESLLNLDMITLRITAFPIPVASQIDKIFAGPTDPICLLIQSRWMSSGLFGPNFEIPFILSQNSFSDEQVERMQVGVFIKVSKGQWKNTHFW